MPLLTGKKCKCGQWYFIDEDTECFACKLAISPIINEKPNLFQKIGKFWKNF